MTAPDLTPDAVERLAKSLAFVANRTGMTVEKCEHVTDDASATLRALSAERDALTAELESALGKLENAGQAMSETQPSWEYRCHAIMAALGLDYGGPTPDIPEEHTWYSRNLKRASARAEAAEAAPATARNDVLESAALLAETTTAAPAQYNAKDHWRAEIGREVAAAIRSMKGGA